VLESRYAARQGPPAESPPSTVLPCCSDSQRGRGVSVPNRTGQWQSFRGGPPALRYAAAVPLLASIAMRPGGSMGPRQAGHRRERWPALGRQGARLE